MGKVFGIAILSSIVGWLTGRILGSVLTGGLESQKVAFDIYTAVGWGAGGIIGALAGVGSIVREGYQHQNKTPQKGPPPTEKKSDLSP
jgi:hypothetical protein